MIVIASDSSISFPKDEQRSACARSGSKPAGLTIVDELAAQGVVRGTWSARH